jgi:hypothetical protein
MFATMNVRTLRLPIVIALLVFALAACGKDLQPSPTTAPSATHDDATPAGLTVGVLADRIAEGWKTVDRYRSETTTTGLGTPESASPEAETPSTEVIEEVILPDQRRQVVTTNGVEQSEIVAAGGNIYGRGPNLPGISQPNRDPEVWITINGNVLGPNNAFSGFYQSLLLPAQPPYAALTEGVRNRPAEELGAAELGGRICRRYRIVDTTLTGERVVVVLSLAEDGLVCAIETTSDSSVTTSIFTYDQPASIELPASPVPAPVENG